MSDVKTMRQTSAAGAVFAVMVLLLFGFGGADLAAADVDEVKREFAEICADSTNGGSLGKEQLQSYLARCDKLEARIEKLEDTDRRFYLRRLKSCRDLYQFMLDTAEKNKPASTSTGTAQ
jgi:hypothetical protein